MSWGCCFLGRDGNSRVDHKDKFKRTKDKSSVAPSGDYDGGHDLHDFFGLLDNRRHLFCWLEIRFGDDTQPVSRFPCLLTRNGHLRNEIGLALSSLRLFHVRANGRPRTQDLIHQNPSDAILFQRLAQPDDSQRKLEGALLNIAFTHAPILSAPTPRRNTFVPSPPFSVLCPLAFVLLPSPFVLRPCHPAASFPPSHDGEVPRPSRGKLSQNHPERWILVRVPAILPLP